MATEYYGRGARKAPRRSSAASKPVASPELRDAAEKLGAVYMMLAGMGYLPLDRRDIPDTTRLGGKDVPNVSSRTLDALRGLYNDPKAEERGYIDSYRLIKASLATAAATAAAVTLNEQVKSLQALDRRLHQADEPERLHIVARNVRRRIDSFLPSGVDYEHARSKRMPSKEHYDREYQKLANQSFLKRVRAALAAELRAASPGSPGIRKGTADLWKVLSLHPEVIKILQEYSYSGKDGSRLAHRLVTEAMAATARFDATLRVNPDHVWRYPPLIALGVKQLGLDDVDAFPEWAVDIGQVLLSKSWIDDALGAMGLVILLVGILLTGPLAVTGVALNATLTGLALADVATTGAAAYLTYLHEREQDIAGTGSGFTSGRIAERSDYSGTALAGAATLLCGIAFVFSGVKLRRSWSARRPGTPPSPKGPAARRRATATDTTSTANKAVEHRGTDATARFHEYERGPFAGPTRSRQRQTGARQVRSAAAGSGQPDPSTGVPRQQMKVDDPKATSPTATGSKATESTATSPQTAHASASQGTQPSFGAGGRPSAAAATPPGGSAVADTSFSLTPQQRSFPTKVLTHETEKAVGTKLEQATGLTAKSERTTDAIHLREQIPSGSKAAPITKPVLLKEPVITDPRKPARADILGSAKPDYLLLGPKQHEVFEVTVDSRFSIVPQERGIQFRGSANPLGDPHKQIQVRKTLDYLIRRYPDHHIIYNIQTTGEVPSEVLTILQTEQGVAKRLVAAQSGNGSVEIVVRASKSHIFR